MARVNRIPWWEWWIPFRRWRIVGIFEAADDIPARLPARGAVIVGSYERPKWIAFDCPCNTGHRILITLDLGHHPHWKIVSHKRLTIAPSVDFRTKEQRCHYFIRHGLIEWVPDSFGGNRGKRS